MKNKHFLFSLSLTVAVAIIMVLSIFIHNTVFDEIAQVITIPFLLFTLVSFAFSVSESIISLCEAQIALENEKQKFCKYYKNNLERLLEGIKKHDLPQNASEIKTNELIDQREQDLKDASENIEKFSLNILTLRDIITKCQRNKILSISYTVLLSFLIVFMMISSLIAPYFGFIPTATLTLLSLFFAIVEILLKDIISNKIFSNMYKRQKEKIEANSHISIN